MEKTIRRPGWWQPLLIGAAGALTAWIPLLIGVVPSFLVYLGVAGGYWQLLLCAAVSGGALYLLTGLKGLWLLLPLLLPAVAVTVSNRQKTTHFNGMLLSCAASASGLYGLFCFPSLFAGQTAFYGVEQAMARFFELLRQLPDMAELLALYGFGSIEELSAMLIAQVQVIVPCMACLFGGVIGFVTYLLPRRIWKGFAPDVRPMEKFRSWRVPKNAAWGIVTMLAAALIVSAGGFMHNMDAVVPAVIVVALYPFFLQGLCLLAFLSSLPRPGCFHLGLILPLLILTFPACLLTVCLLGLIEQFVKFRSRYIGPPPV